MISLVCILLGKSGDQYLDALKPFFALIDDKSVQLDHSAIAQVTKSLGKIFETMNR